jgi:hypothetical protein
MSAPPEYELGDFVLAMDEMSKAMTEELTGKGSAFVNLHWKLGEDIFVLS